MASQADLITALRNTHIGPSGPGPSHNSRVHKLHILTLEFPATDLLPLRTNPYIAPPAHLEKRHKPDAASQPSSGETEFFALLPSASWAVLRITPSNDNCATLVHAIENLRRTPGTSKLCMVSFVDNERGGIVHRFQLRTITTNIFIDSFPRDFELSGTELGRLMEYADHGYTWVYLLRDLLTRASDRGFIEVRSTLLNAYGDLAVISEENQWENLWYLQPARGAEELLIAQLQPVSAADEAGLHMAADCYLDLCLPCGHKIHVRKIEILALNAERCLTLQCPTCSARVMQKEDDIEISLGKDVERAEAFRVSSATWRSLDGKVPTSAAKRIVRTRTILSALDVALNSFSSPRLICPPSLSPVVLYAPETTMVMQHFGSTYGRSSVDITITPLDLLESLYGTAMSTDTGDAVVLAKAAMPPGWERFLIDWLTRIVNFLCERRCIMRGPKGLPHLGVHEHEDGVWFYSDAAEEAEWERQMQGMVDGMRDADI